MWKTVSKIPIIFFTFLTVLSSVSCTENESEIQPPDRIIEIPIETQSLTATKTKKRITYLTIYSD
jgi:hypothetical protein